MQMLDSATVYASRVGWDGGLEGADSAQPTGFGRQWCVEDRMLTAEDDPALC